MLATGTSTAPDGQATVEFASSHYAVLESMQQITAEVRRYDHTASKVRLRYTTRDGSAKSGEDYVHAEGIIEFAPNETVQKIKVVIIDDNEWEMAEDFYIELSNPICDNG